MVTKRQKANRLAKKANAKLKAAKSDAKAKVIGADERVAIHEKKIVNRKIRNAPSNPSGGRL